MIPHRMFPSEFSNNGLRDRVTACRKRLREKRVMFRTPATATGESLFLRSAGGSASLASINQPLTEVEAGEPIEVLVSIEQQEVGIT